MGPVNRPEVPGADDGDVTGSAACPGHHTPGGDARGPGGGDATGEHGGVPDHVVELAARLADAGLPGPWEDLLEAAFEASLDTGPPTGGPPPTGP